MIVDVHTHIYNKKNWESYKKKSKGQVGKAIVLAWYHKNNYGFPCVSDLVKFTSNETNLFAIGSIDLKANLKPQISLHDKLFKENKIVGIKLYPGYQHFYPTDKKVTQIAKLCERYNKPLVFHSGDFYDQEGTALLKYSHPMYIDELASLCPNTKIVISHFGFPYQMETANIVSKNKNVFTDISGTIDGGDKTSKETGGLTKQYISDLKRVFNYYPNVKAKTMFGTDYAGEEYPLNQITPYIEVVKKTMNKNELANSFYQLAQQIYFE